MSLAPTSAESPASVCRVCPGPTRTEMASSAVHRAPAAMGSAWLVPATCLNVEASVGSAGERPSRDGAGTGQGRGASCLHGDPKAKARSQVMYCKVPCSLQSLSSLSCGCSYRAHCRCPVSTCRRAPQLASTGLLSCGRHFAKDFTVCKHVIIYRSTCVCDGGTWHFIVDQTCHILCTLVMEGAMYLGQNCLIQRTLQFAL